MGSKLVTYQKHNSFVDIRRKNPDVWEVYDRIKMLFQTLQDEDVPLKWRALIQRMRDELIRGIYPEDGIFFEIHPYVEEEIKRIPQRELLRYLIYRYRYEIFPKKKLLDNFPPCLQIEPVSICNYRCIFCYQTDTTFTRRQNGHMGMMNLDLFKALIDQAEGHCEAVTLASRGEPLVCRDIEQMLAYCRDKFLGLKINTNASLMDERKSHAILQSGMNTLVFSVDAASEPLYSQLRVGGNLNQVANNIRRFQEIREKKYPNSTLITRVSGVKIQDDQNLNELEIFWGDLVDQVAFVKYNPWENTYLKPVNEISEACSDLWRRMFVWFDGTVNPCDVDYKSTLTVGNTSESSLSEIWQSEAYRGLRKKHFSNNRCLISPCNRCMVV